MQVLGLGLCLSFIMVGLTWLSNRYSSNSTKNVEEFTSASHSVKPGLIAAGIVSGRSNRSLVESFADHTLQLGRGQVSWRRPGTLTRANPACFAATLLQSTSIVYKFGISGAWWYVTGAYTVPHGKLTRSLSGTPLARREY